MPNVKISLSTKLGVALQYKIAFARPMDQWMSDWEGPKNDLRSRFRGGVRPEVGRGDGDPWRSGACGTPPLSAPSHQSREI